MIATTYRARFLVLVATLSCVATFCSPALAQDKPRGVAETPNAALRYWTAFALLDAADPAKFNVEDNWREGPITEEAREQLNQLDSAFVYLHLAAMTEHCDWEILALDIDAETGKKLLLPHLSEARRMYRCAVYRARMYVADGEPEKAAELMTDVAAMGRSLGKDAMLICLILQYVTEEVALDFTASELIHADTDKTQLAEIANAWAKIPPGGTVAESLAIDTEWMSIWNGRNGNAATSELMGLMKPEQEKIFAMASLPYAERVQQLPLLRIALKGRPLASGLLQSAEASLAAEDRLTAKRAMLLAGIDIAINGPDAVQKHLDPFADNQPFTFEAHEGGFTLRSALTIPQRGDAPVELTFGKAKK